jgi:hypothetical protein
MVEQMLNEADVEHGLPVTVMIDSHSASSGSPA